MTGDGRLVQALAWIARLPLCGDPELAGLIGVDGHDARRLIHELARRGWVETVEPGSPELELRRLAFVREDAIPALAAALCLDPAEIAGALPVRLRDTLERITRVEITVGVNRVLAGLAADVQRSGLAELADARSLPLALPPPERWWLPLVEGYGCLRAGPLHAPFLLAWDRAAAPNLYRRRRVAAWFAASAAVARHWGAEGLPPVLVVCPSTRVLRVWEEALSKQYDTEGAQLEVLLATREQLRSQGPGAATWRSPGRTQASPLVELIGWGQVPPVAATRLAEPFEQRPPPHRRGASLRERALAGATAHDGGPLWHRLGVLALATGPAEKALIEWVARHPLLSAADLAALLDTSEALIKRRLEWLTRCGAIRSAAATCD
ncbi:MAG: hypothetical protein R3C39_11065 [Dehalococcoidia bacterium]